MVIEYLFCTSLHLSLVKGRPGGPMTYVLCHAGRSAGTFSWFWITSSDKDGRPEQGKRKEMMVECGQDWHVDWNTNYICIHMSAE